jgi:hypothetical protein
VTKIDPPITGFWTINGLPEVVIVARRRFRRAVLKQEYPHVVAQYREDVERQSRHLKVFGNGVWIIDHIDDDNPDRGRAIPHFFNDHPLGPIVALGLLLGGAAMVGKAIAR